MDHGEAGRTGPRSLISAPMQYIFDLTVYIRSIRLVISRTLPGYLSSPERADLRLGAK